MHAIIPELLYLGHALDARDPQQLFEHRVAAVVDLAFEEPPAALPRSLIYCRFPLIDGAGNERRLLRLAVHTVAALLSDAVPALVACGAGMSRSPAVAAVALAIHRQQPPEEMLREIVTSRTHDVSPAFWREIVQVV